VLTVKKIVLMLLSFCVGAMSSAFLISKYNRFFIPPEAGDEYLFLLPKNCLDKSRKALMELGDQYSLQEKRLSYKLPSAGDYEEIVRVVVKKATTSTTSDLLDSIERVCNEVQINIPRDENWEAELNKILLREQIVNGNLSMHISVEPVMFRVFIPRETLN
jgi:hypothetical protein